MPDNKQQNSDIRTLKWTSAALGAWAVGYVGALRILKHHPHSAWVRGGAVALAVFGFLSWLGWMAKGMRMANEFTRQVQLVASGFAFAATAIFIFICDMLQRAAFIDYVTLMTIWVFMVGAWLISIILASVYYR
jgi:hypothetical protein